MSTQRLEIDGIAIEIQRKPIKNMNLRIYPPDGLVRVSAPFALSLRQIRRQIEAKREWIQAQQARIKARPVYSEPAMQTGERHDFLGEPYTLNVYEGVNKANIVLEGKVLHLRTNANPSVVEKHALLQRWYRAQMLGLLPDLIKKWQAVIDVTVAEYGVKIMKTRWGSCNIQARRIWLNLALIKTPLTCLESVLVHEMTHLLEASHNARFYALMDQFMPNWRTYQQALKSLTLR